MAYKDDPIRVAKSLVITRTCPVSKKQVDIAMCWYCRCMSINGCMID